MLRLSTTYFGPISWYRQLNAADTCIIDPAEHFRKRTFRNRCEIATPNGRQTLTVPVEHHTTEIARVRISEHNKWRHVHWQALETAYGNSPFFDYYVDDIRPFFLPDWEYLFDLNLAIIHKMCELLQIETTVVADETGERYQPCTTPASSLTQPKESRDATCKSSHRGELERTLERRPYYQVHAHRTGFLPDLSILDLLFNMGNESILFL